MKPIDVNMMMKKGHNTSFFPPSLHSWMVDKNLSTNAPFTISGACSARPQVPTLVALCQRELIMQLEKNSFNSKMVKDICKYIPEELLEPIFEKLIESKKINDMILMIYLSPNRQRLAMNNLVNIRNSIFKLTGYHCPHLTYLDLSDCSQVSNSVIRVILTGCPALETIKLDRCMRITDSAFDFASIPFNSFVSCFSLECISLQECPQITGEIIYTLNKNCRSLIYLSLSQCKHLKANDLQYLFQHENLTILNLSFIDGVTDDTFQLLPKGKGIAAPTIGLKSSRSNSPSFTLARSRSATPPADPTLPVSPIQILNLCKAPITDIALEHFFSLSQLIEVRLSWCTNVTDTGIHSLVMYCPQLQSLDVTSCSITNKSLADLGKLCARNLKELDISWCMEVNNDGLRYLLPMYQDGDEVEVGSSRETTLTHPSQMGQSVSDGCGGCVSHLERLSLVWCPQVNNETLEILSNIPSLKYLAINGCNEVTAQAIDVMRQDGLEIVS